MGDTVGCGINAEGYLFFTRNQKIFATKIRLSPELVYPVLGFSEEADGLITVQITPTIPGGIPLEKQPLTSAWDKRLANPLGKIQLKPPIQQDIKLLSFPHDVLKILIGSGMGCLILETCRALYQRLSPLYTWENLFQLTENITGWFVDRSKATGRDRTSLYSFGFEISKNGTWKGKIKTLNGTADQDREGTWSLRRKRSQQKSGRQWDDVLVLHMMSTIKDDLMPKKIDVSAVYSMEVKTRQEAFENLQEPKYIIRKLKCGVPLEQQVGGVDCCYEIVEQIVDSVWDERYQSLGDDIKKAISQRVSHRCMAPPGMSDDEIRIAIAEEIATCDEWNDAFQQVVS